MRRVVLIRPRREGRIFGKAPGSPFCEVLERENRLLDMPWKYYDTAHVTFMPRNFTVEQLRSAYDWLCRKTYSPFQIVYRGLRSH